MAYRDPDRTAPVPPERLVFPGGKQEMGRHTECALCPDRNTDDHRLLPGDRQRIKLSGFHICAGYCGGGAQLPDLPSGGNLWQGETEAGDADDTEDGVLCVDPGGADVWVSPVTTNVYKEKGWMLCCMIASRKQDDN